MASVEHIEKRRRHDHRRSVNDHPDDLHTVLRDLKAGVEKIYQQHAVHAALHQPDVRIEQVLHDLNREVDMLNATVLRYSSVCQSESTSLLCQKFQYPPLHIVEGKGDPWVRWWAWYPVTLTLSGKTVWGRWVEVRKFHAARWFLDGNRWWWEYREVPKAVPK